MKAKGEPHGLVGAAAITAVLEEWEELWISPLRHDEAHPREWQYPWTLDPIFPEKIFNACKGFPTSTGLGWDNFHLKLAKYLDAGFVERMAQIFSSWEQNPVCENMWVTICVFIPKPDGGTRPIGLLPFWARIWSRCRSPYVKQWEASVDSKFFWGKDAATSCDKAAYLHNMLSVFARRRGLTAVTVFYDIRKFYENVSHSELRSAADHFGFDGGLLRALCCLYRSPRRARWTGGTSRISHPNGTIIAGCSAATGVAKLMTLALLKRIDSETPPCRALNVVDDLTTHTIGGPATAVENTIKSFDIVTSELGQRHLPINWDKTYFMLSDHALVDKFTSDPRWTLQADKLVIAHRDLGGDSLDGRARRVATQASRIEAANRTGVALRQLGQSEKHSRVYRVGALAKATRGSHILGIPPTTLHKLRVQAARSWGSLLPGSSLGFRFLSSPRLWPRGPLVVVVASAVKEFVSVWWARSVSKPVLEACVQDALEVQSSRAPWGQVRQPVAALF